MKESNRYKSHWNNKKFNEIFLNFKKFVLEAEFDFTKQVAEHTLKNLKRKKIKILDIGIGDGTVSLSFLNELTKSVEISKYTGIDLTQELVELSNNKKKEFEKLAKEVEFKCQDASKYSTKDSFDLIVAFNSWYGIPFEQIQNFLSILNEEGILIILLNPKDCISLDLTRKFSEHIISSEDLMKWLDKQKIHYTKKRLITEKMNREDFILRDKINPKAEFFYRYLLRKINGPLDDIFNYLIEKPKEYFNLPQDLLIIRK